MPAQCGFGFDLDQPGPHRLELIDLGQRLTQKVMHPWDSQSTRQKVERKRYPRGRRSENMPDPMLGDNAQGWVGTPLFRADSWPQGA